MSNKDKEDRWISWFVYGSVIPIGITAYVYTDGNLLMSFLLTLAGWFAAQVCVPLVILPIFVLFFGIKDDPKGCLSAAVGIVVLIGFFVILGMLGFCDGKRSSSGGNPNCVSGPRGVICD